MPLISLLMFSLLVCADPIDGPLQGVYTTCNVEGELMTLPGITDSPCIICHCRSRQVECRVEVCSELEGCRAALIDESGNTCCGVCKGCHVNRTLYPSGAQWTHPDDPCKRFICEAGILTVSHTKCLVDCLNPIYTTGQCCPSCAGCEYNGKDHLNGEIFPHSDLAEVQCTCNDGEVTCAYHACPVLNCPEAAQYKRNNESCPRCNGTRKTLDLRTSCFFSGITVSQGAVIHPDNCTRCTCLNGSLVCQREVCTRPRCDVSQYRFTRKSCCPRCNKERSCKHTDITYKSRKSWWPSGDCTRCRCKDGVIYCGRDPCPTRKECPAGRFVKKLADSNSCCPPCVNGSHVGRKKQQHTQPKRHQRLPQKKNNGKKMIKKTVTSVTHFAEGKRHEKNKKRPDTKFRL